MEKHFTIITATAAIVIAIIYIMALSLLKEPDRQKLNAIILAGAGAVYWSGGLGVWEFVFGSLLLFIAFKGLKHYYFIGIGWLLHTAWDILHHFYGNPIVYFESSSSAGCAVCDTFLAIWFFFNAPSFYSLFKKYKTTTL